MTEVSRSVGRKQKEGHCGFQECLNVPRLHLRNVNMMVAAGEKRDDGEHYLSSGSLSHTIGLHGFINCVFYRQRISTAADDTCLCMTPAVIPVPPRGTRIGAGVSNPSPRASTKKHSVSISSASACSLEMSPLPPPLKQDTLTTLNRIKIQDRCKQHHPYPNSTHQTFPAFMPFLFIVSFLISGKGMNQGMTTHLLPFFQCALFNG